MKESQKPSVKRSIFFRLGRILLFRIFLPVSLACAAAAISLCLLCVYRPEVIAAGVQRQLSSFTGLPWIVKGYVQPRFYPFLGIAASDVSILAASLEQERLCPPDRPLVRANKVSLFLDIAASLRDLSPRFTLLELVSPEVNLAYDAHGRPLWLPLDKKDSREVIPGSQGAPGVPESAPEGGTPDVAAPDAPPAKDKGTSRSAPAFFGWEGAGAFLLPARVIEGSFTRYNENGAILFSCTGINGSFKPSAQKDNLVFSADISLPGADLEMAVSLGMNLSGQAPANGAFSADLRMMPPGSRTLTGRAASSFVLNDKVTEAFFPDFRLRAEGDELSADLALDLTGPSLTGKVRLHSLSLPRWFVFGRLVPPGLRQALHNVTGEFDLYFDRGRAEALALTARAGTPENPLFVRGYVGTKDFGKPVVEVDLALDEARADPLFPFLAVAGISLPEPAPPEFDHPVLAPYPEIATEETTPEEDDDGIDVGYDVKIRVARPELHNVYGGPASVLVFPVRENGRELTRVEIVAEDLLDGKAHGVLDIDEDAIAMRYLVQDMELPLLPENMDNTVLFGGKVSGSCDIVMPRLADGSLADDWQLGVKASAAKFFVKGHQETSPWGIAAATATLDGSGLIHAVARHGIRIGGKWVLAGQKLSSSWNPKGNEALSVNLQGDLVWPPFVRSAPSEPGLEKTIERRGLQSITGSLKTEGTLTVPVGSLLAPVSGKMESELEWLLHENTMRFTRSQYTGAGSHSAGSIFIDFSGKEVVVASDAFFTLNPIKLLREWGVEAPSGMRIPALLTGSAEIRGTPRSLLFDNLRVEAEGAPISGNISWLDADPSGSGPESRAKPGKGLWTFRLVAEHLDIDRIFPPEASAGSAKTPEKPAAPWNLRFLKDQSIDAHLVLTNAKRRGMTFSGVDITATLQKDRFSAHATSASFYDGSATFLAQGTVTPEQSRISLRKGLLRMQGVSLGNMLYDLYRDTSYAGTADLVFDVNGVLRSSGDVPGNLSGDWSIQVKDGLYPAFLGKEGSELRNTFSVASCSGVLDKGVLRSENFLLSGPMVAMHGKGWADLGKRETDTEISVTFAKVPTVPVRFYGPFARLRMSISGTDMVVETVQAAGSTVFNLVTGILSLPAQAISGIASAFEGEGGDKNGNRKK